jgi:glycine oxidase
VTAAGSADVVIVGGGVIGLSIAWRAAQAGFRVTVCDPDPGHGASWAAAGMLAPVTEATVVEAALASLGLVSAGMWPAFAAEVEAAGGVDPGLRNDGTLAVAFDNDDRRVLEELRAVHRTLGLRSEWLSAKECRVLEPMLSPLVRGGVAVAGDWQVDNRALLRALVGAVDRCHVEIRRRAVVLLRGGETWIDGVELDDGEVLPAAVVVLAAGAWSGRIGGVPPSARPPVRPVKGEIIRLSGPTDDPVLSRTVRAYVRGRSVYLVPRGNGEVVVGASMQEAGFSSTVRAGAISELLADAIAVVPAVAELDLVETTARLRPGTPDNGPILGTTPVDGLLLATGHHRNGILLAPVTAFALVAALRGQSLPVEAKAFTLERFR